MGNQNGNILSQAEIGRRPTDQEMMVLLQLQRKLFTRLVLSPQHLALLERYWKSHFVNKSKAPAFERISTLWCTEGGFRTENPADDLRSMGELGLQCLVFFAEQYPGESRMMKRAKGGYPFVVAAMAVARSLCEAMHLVDEQGQAGSYPVAETLYWQIVENEESFYRLFSLSFLLFEEMYCDELATNRTLPVTERIPISVVTQLVDATKAKLLDALKLAPLQLDDLRSLCLNANHILDNNTSLAHATEAEAAPSKYSAAKAARARSASMPAQQENGTETDRLAQWKTHHTTRKSMKDLIKNWHGEQQHEQPTEGVVPRLTPRMPEMAFAAKKKSTSDVDPEEACLGLFDGLVTKSAELMAATTATATAMPSPSPSPAAAS